MFTSLQEQAFHSLSTDKWISLTELGYNSRTMFSLVENGLAISYKEGKTTFYKALPNVRCPSSKRKLSDLELKVLTMLSSEWKIISYSSNIRIHQALQSLLRLKEVEKKMVKIDGRTVPHYRLTNK